MSTWSRFNDEIDGIYTVKDSMIIPRHNYLAGSKNYVLATLEQIIGNLSRPKVDDQLIQFLNSSLVEFVKQGEERYYKVIEEVNKLFGDGALELDELLNQVKERFSNNVLTNPEKVVLQQICEMNLTEYLFKSDYQKCDYSTMTTLSKLAYQILLQGLDKHIKDIEILVTTNGEITSWEYEYCDEKVEHIWIEWKSLDKVDHYYSIYESSYCGLKDESKLDLASADAVEEMFTQEDKKVMSFNMLVKQYCGVIEQEINEIIQLKNLRNKPNKHLMWKNMKDYVRDNNIELIGGLYTLNEVLEELHIIRNLASHGEKITKEQYDMLRYYKERQLFEFISWTKLELRGEKIAPTVDDMMQGNYTS